MEKCKTELDIKLNEHLINAAREIKMHCTIVSCKNCIFNKASATWIIDCRLDPMPENWEVDSDKL